jgi:hypothetical protein
MEEKLLDACLLHRQANNEVKQRLIPQKWKCEAAVEDMTEGHPKVRLNRASS